MKSRIALLIAIALGFLAALAVRQYVKEQERALNEGEKPVDIVVASKELRPGTPVTIAVIKSTKVPIRYLPSQDCVTWNERQMIIGQKLNCFVKRDEPIRKSFILEQGEVKDQGLQGKLTIGRRGFSISIDRIRGVAGMIQPGDHIDLLLTQRVAANEPGAEATKIVVFPLVRGVEVLATGQQMSRQEASPDRQKGKEGYSTLTLDVTPIEASLILYANQTGTITATLRNKDDVEASTTASVKVTSDNFHDIQQQADEKRKEKSDLSGESREEGQ